MAKKRETSTALEVMQNVKTMATRLGESADGYLSMMESEPRPEVKVGEFYKTFDGSLVYICRRRSSCRCPICGGESDQAAGPLGMFIQMSPIMGDMLAKHQADTAAEHKEQAETQPEFIVSILKGGHGIKDVRGEEPGDTYVIDDQGWLVLSKLDDSNKESASKTQLALCGLSLRRQLNVKVQEDA